MLPAMRVAVPVLVLLLACGDDDGSPDAGASDAGGQDASSPDAASDAGPPPPPRARLDVDGGFWDAPFPIAHRARDDGSLVVADFPNTRRADLIDQLVEMLEDGSQGFAPTGAVFLPFEGEPLDPETLPDVAGSLEDGASVYLVDVDPSSPHRGERFAVQARFKADAETYMPANVLVVLPFPGVVLRERTEYAVVVTDAVRGASGSTPRIPDALVALRDGTSDAPERTREAFGDLFELLGDDADAVVAATVFRTGDPFAELRAWRESVADLDPPTLEDPVQADDYDDYCVVRASLALPVFQEGPKPYASPPTGRIVAEDGVVVVQERDEVELYLTLPKREMPAAGFPLVLYAAGAGGTGRQVIDRTRLDENPDEGLGPPGRGPARFYAQVGLASAGAPAPLTAERNPEGREGTLDFWNVANLRAFRGNLQQAILDFTTLARVVSELELDPSLCPGATTDDVFRYDPERIYLQGHSTGGTVGSAVLPLEPRIRGGVLSGTGGSWIYNVADALGPFELEQAARLLLSIPARDPMDHFDIELTLFQTVLASTETMSWGRVTALEPPDADPKDTLFVAGIVDTYHLPRMVNSQGMSLGADMALPAAEETWEDEYALVGLGGLTPPVRANLGERTVVTLQREQRLDFDGHYVPFEWDDVKWRYACFLATHARDGVATLPNADADASCVE